MPVYNCFIKHLYLGEWPSTHLAVERNTHSFHDPVVFDRCVKSWLLRLPLCCSYHQLSVLSHQLSVGDAHDTQLNFMNDLSLKG